MMMGPSRDLRGRGAEQAEILAAIGAARGRDGGCVVIEGPAGSGRTALLESVLRELDDVLVLRAAGSVDEQVLAYAVLSDLCRPLHAHLCELPDLQQSALRGAIALGPPAGDRLAVAAGFLSLLRTAAEAEPLVVVAVDDAHHLDDGSATAIGYAARRLDGCPIAMVIVQDVDEPARLKLPDVPRTRLGPVGFDDAMAIVGQVAPDTPPAVGDELIATSRALPGQLVRLLRAVAPGSGGATPSIDLDEAGQRAVARGSPADEAAILERAAEAIADHERAAVLVQAGEAWLAAGQPDQAQRCAAAAGADAHGADLARAQLLLARATLATGSGREARRALAEVAELAASLGETEIAARALLVALPLHLHLGRIEDARHALDEVRDLLEPMPDELTETHLLMRAAEIGVALAAGEPVDASELIRLLDAGLRAPGRSEVPVLVTTVVMPLVWADRLSAARHVLEGIISRTRQRGALGLLALPLAALATVERRSGRATRALAAAAEAEQLAEETADHVALMFARTELANVLAQRGDADRARSVAHALLGGERPVQGSLAASARSALATVELIEGNWEAVVEVLAPVAASDAGSLSPLVTLYQQHLAVAYAMLRRVAEAETTIEALERASASGVGGRLPAVVERCRGMLAPSGEYDACFERALSLVGGNSLGTAITQLLHAHRMLGDGRTTEAMALLSMLAGSTDENSLGVARAARQILAQLGVELARSKADEIGRLSDEELRVVLAAADGRSIDHIADEMRTTPGEVTRLRANAFQALGVHTTEDLQQTLEPTVHSMGAPLSDTGRTRVRLLGGLEVVRDGHSVVLPAGSVATALAMIALKRTVHVEQLIEVLWPGTTPELGRRRIRNVLARLKATAGPMLHRHGEQLILDRSVAVDVHELDAALDVAIDPRCSDDDRAGARSHALRLYRGLLLPELPFAEWAAPDRARLAMARSDLLRSLVERMAVSGEPDEALAVAEQALADAPDDEDLLVRAAELAIDAGRPSRARGLLRRARERRASLGVSTTAHLDDLTRRVDDLSTQTLTARRSRS